MNKLRNIAREIKLLVMDVDGVLTDGNLYFSNEGEAMKTFSTQDGHAIKMLQEYGVTAAIITGRNSGIVAKRAENLKIQHLLQGREDKAIALQELCKQIGVETSECAYMGDDLPDLGAIQLAGLGIAVSNAHEFVRKHADMITQHSGGNGAVKEVCEFILDCQGNLNEALESYLMENITGK